MEKAYNDDDEDAKNIKIEHAQMIIALIDASQAAALLAWRGLVFCGRIDDVVHCSRLKNFWGVEVLHRIEWSELTDASCLCRWSFVFQ